MEYSISTTIKATDREGYRYKLITLFLNEKHGSSKEVMSYLYYVETLSDGRRIYLKRPTALNKGVDFEVRVENQQFRYGKYGNTISTGNRPSHSDIITDLANKKKENSRSFALLKDLVAKVYNCQDITKDEINNCDFKGGMPTEMLLLVLKWLFIEQDITYWNRSGREMLFNGLLEVWDK